MTALARSVSGCAPVTVIDAGGKTGNGGNKGVGVGGPGTPGDGDDRVAPAGGTGWQKVDANAATNAGTGAGGTAGTDGT